MHVSAGQEVHHIGGIAQRDPVELHVLAGGEVGIALREAGGFDGVRVVLDQALGVELVLRVLGGLEQGGIGLVVLAGNGGQGAQLFARELTIRHGDSEHGGVALNVPAVL